MPSKDFRRRSAEWSTPVPEPPVVFSKTTHGRQSHRIQSQSGDASETAGTTAGYATSGEELSSREAELERERDNYKDLLLRRTAEFENFRKRTERERVAQSESAAADLVSELRCSSTTSSGRSRPKPAAKAPTPGAASS